MDEVMKLSIGVKKDSELESVDKIYGKHTDLAVYDCESLSTQHHGPNTDFILSFEGFGHFVRFGGATRVDFKVVIDALEEDGINGIKEKFDEGPAGRMAERMDEYNHPVEQYIKDFKSLYEDGVIY